MKNKIVPFVILFAFLGVILFLNWSYVFISDDCFYGSICVDGHWQHLGTIATAFSVTLKDLHRPVVHFIVRVFTGCFDKWVFNVANTVMMGLLLLLVSRVAVSYNYPKGLLAMLKREAGKPGRPVIPNPERPFLLKTRHGSYYLVAKESFSDPFIKDVTLD